MPLSLPLNRKTIYDSPGKEKKNYFPERDAELTEMAGCLGTYIRHINIEIAKLKTEFMQ